MMKRKVLILSLLAALLVALAGVAMAEADPIVCSMELNPDKLTGPGTVNVTITISNSGDTAQKLVGSCRYGERGCHVKG